LRLNPRNVEALSNLGVVLQIVEDADLEVARQQIDEAIRCCQQALEIQPNSCPRLSICNCARLKVIGTKRLPVTGRLWSLI